MSKNMICVGTGAMVFNSEGKVLLTQRGHKARDDQGMREFPGGAVEFGENTKQATIREIKEECNIDITIVRLLEVYENINTIQHRVCTSYIATYMGGELKRMEPEKCTAVKRVSLDELNNYELTNVTKSNYKAYRNLKY